MQLRTSSLSSWQQAPACGHQLLCSRRDCRVRYRPSGLETLFQQARQAPVVTDVDDNRLQQQQQQQLLQPQPQQHQQQQQQQHKPKAVQAPKTPVNGLEASKVPAEQPLQMPVKQLRPSQMDFGTMFAQLQAWRQRHLTAHVPRHCFDAPDLGAWVRYLRKQHKEGQLEHWKVDSLSALGFEWELTDQEAKWHHLYHQLRRYRVLYGTTHVDVSRGHEDGCDWRLVAWWLRKQARLLAKQKLSSQQRAMLQQLGVRLVVPKQLVQRTAQLQALNGTERRQLRKKWKLLDNTRHEAARRQRQQELQQLLQERQQQRRVLQRRERLMQLAVREAAVEPPGQDAQGQLSAQGLQDGPEGRQQLARLALQRVQQVQQLSWQLVAPAVPPGAHHQMVQKPVLPLVPADSSIQACGGTGSCDRVAGGVFKLDTQQEHSPVEDAQQARQQHEQHAPQQDTALQPQPQPQPQQEPTPQPPSIETNALLFAPNRRRKRVQHKSRHEQWLASAAAAATPE